jgi:hypothetical protein
MPTPTPIGLAIVARFNDGDPVLVKFHPPSSKPLQLSAKFARKWAGPIVIVKFLTNVTAQLANLDTGVTVKRAHVSQLKKYHGSI